MQDKIREQIKDALRAKNELRLTTLRGVLAAFTNESVNLGRTPQDPLGDNESIAVIKRLAKQRKDSIEQFEKGGRQDLADNEKAELEILNEFLPEQMSESAIEEIVKTVVNQARTSGKISDNSSKSIGVVMGLAMKETKGLADGDIVKQIVTDLLSS